MIIVIDFDGTCVTHEYPEMGLDIGAIPVLKELIKNGNKLILLTMRSGRTLKDAKKWFVDNDIDFWSVNFIQNKRVGQRVERYMLICI